MDKEWFLTINGWAGRSPVLDWVMLQVSQESNLWIPGIVLIVFWAWRKWGEAKIAIPCIALLVGISDWLGGQLKILIGRPRPCQVLPHIHELVGCGGAWSMPSNHAMNSSTVISFLVVLYPALGWILWPFLALIGVSRVYLGAHYVSDVFVGFAFGIVLGGAAGYLIKTRVLGTKFLTGQWRWR